MKQILISFSTIILLSFWNLSVSLKEVSSQNIKPKLLLFTQTSWQLFNSPQGNFQVKFPLEPKLVKDFTDIEGQKLDWLIYRVDDDIYWNPDLNEEDSPSVYLVGYTDLSTEYIQQGGNDLNNLLKRLSNSLIEEFELTELNSEGKSISLDGQPGLEFLGNSDIGFATMRLYLIEQRLYALYGASEELHNIEQFFNSFQLE